MYKKINAFASFIGFLTLMVGPVMINMNAIFCIVNVAVWVALLLISIIYNDYQREKKWSRSE
jgi:hypothetical protein